LVALPGGSAVLDIFYAEDQGARPTVSNRTMTTPSSIPPVGAPEAPAKPAKPSSEPATEAVVPATTLPTPSHGTNTTANAIKATTVASIPYKLRFDVETQRFIIEARDPVSGVLIFQSPPQYAFQQIATAATAGSGVKPGVQVDDKA